jgi:hypothetical protein
VKRKIKTISTRKREEAARERDANSAALARIEERLEYKRRAKAVALATAVATARSTPEEVVKPRFAAFLRNIQNKQRGIEMHRDDLDEDWDSIW